MSLPTINPSRLQGVVANVEFEGEFATFEQLCAAVAKTTWAQTLDLDAEMIGSLMIEHNTITTMEKPAKAKAATPDPKPTPPAPFAPKRPNAFAPKRQKPMPTAEPPEPPKSTGVATYDEGGRGRKQCPACKKYIGARNMVCACGHEFKKAKAEPPKPVDPPKPPKPVDPPTWKALSDPDAVLEESYTPSPTTPTYDAAVKAVTAGGGPIQRANRVYPQDRCLKVSTPAGKPHHELKGCSREEVEEWCERTRRTGLDEHNRFYSKRALTYWLRYFFEMFSDDFTKAKKHIEEMYADEVAVG